MKTIPTSISMSQNLNVNDQPRSLQGIIAGILLVLFASFLLFQYAYAEAVTKSIIAKSADVSAGRAAQVLTGDLANAFSKDPLNQNLVNAGLALNSPGLTSENRAQWIAVIGKMGWRSTAALQTLVDDAMKKQDLRSITVVADALLRRQKFFEETVSLMNLLEAQPATWAGVYTRLKNRAPWRADYLQLAGSIKNPEVIDGRIKTLMMLQNSGDPLTRQELAPSIAVIIGAGRLKEAAQIWRVNAGASRSAIHDANFSIAVGPGANAETSFPFEWQFFSGAGFSAYPSEDGLNGASVAIQWDGRGVPVFMHQLTSATSGHYQFSFNVEGDAQKFATKIGVRFRCGNEVIRLRNTVKPNSQVVTAETITPVKCQFPWVDIFGQVQDRSAAVDLAFNRVMLKRIDK